MPVRKKKQAVVVKEEPQEEAAPSVVEAPTPKKKTSAWLNYYSHYYAHNKPTSGKIKVTEICKDAAAKWRTLSDEQKAKWNVPAASLG